MDERARVVVSDLEASLAFLWLLGHIRRRFPDSEDTLDVRSLVVGAVSGFSIQYASERDPIAPGLERYRTQLLRSFVIQAYHRLLYRFVPSEESVTIGSLVGLVVYRLVFGVLFGVPEGRLQWSSPLRRWLRSK